MNAPGRGAPSAESLGKSGLWSFGGAAASALLGFLVVLVIARALGAADSGVVLQAMAVFMIALGFARFGMDSTAVWLLPRLEVDDPGLIAAAARFLVGASAVAGLVVCAVVFGLTWLPALGSDGGAVAGSVRATIVFLPLMSMLLTALAVNRALGKLRTYVAVGSLGLPALRLMAVCAAVSLGWSASAIAFAWAAPIVPAAVLGLVLLRVGSKARANCVDPGTLRELRARILKFSSPRLAAASLEQILAWAAVLLVGLLGSAEDAGVFGVASRLVAAGLIVDAAIRVVVAPMFSRLHHTQSIEQLVVLHRTATTWLVLLCAPLFLLLAMFADAVLAVMGSSFAQGRAVLCILALATLAAMLAGNVQTVLLTAGRSGLAALNKLCVVILTLALMPVLMPALGVTGAALAVAAASIVDAALAWGEVRWVVGVPLQVSAGLPALGVAIVGVVVPATIVRAIWGAGIAQLIAAGVCAMVIVAGFIAVNRSRLRADLVTAQSGAQTPTGPRVDVAAHPAERIPS